MAKGKPYPPDFRAEAVRLHHTSVRPLAVTAREIGVSDWTLSRWVRQAEIDEIAAQYREMRRVVVAEIKRLIVG